VERQTVDQVRQDDGVVHSISCSDTSLRVKLEGAIQNVDMSGCILELGI
jgi:hypothetical protein